ncbi:GMC family oxidoreductase [Conexibacter sp. CPCC 206217]|uniref:GMC family oxidoreductase n=1 Tax=Conexibacter sp. CPCC 206217 TaxID=3064574 RepID=UPI002728918F|nr:GMC family oxidoreductase N-terminal domain-containing protein [Conexibacter sp. CPCC 206217]MDO8213548.1 GMC family oxidoreductase N-terminal domain-containing protein [Conexibacter sp. CPCC 206217]
MHDYIVVGAGSGGAAAAGRLSEETSARVLLVEAGGQDAGNEYKIPSLWSGQYATPGDWEYWSEPEPFLGGRRLPYPRGKVLGGTSSMNAMLYVRAMPLDFEEWTAAGLRGWSWEDVLPYYKRAEGNVRFESGVHGSTGPLVVSDRVSTNKLTEAWVQAAQVAGHHRLDDFNGPEREGVGFWQLNQRDGKRWSTADAYVRPALERPNFELLTHAQTTRILFEGRRAVGVEVLLRDGTVQQLHAGTEVILAAGAYNTPQLLMLSGIGPAAHLREMGIELREELPVGANLMDHPGTPFIVGVTGESLLGIGSAEDWERYERDGGGRLSSNVVEAGGFFRTAPSEPVPDVQIIVAPVMLAGDGVGAMTQPAYTYISEVTRPTSTGTVALRSSNPLAKPRIVHNHFQTEHDRRVQVAGMRIAMEIADHAPIKDYETERLVYPRSDSDEDLLEHIERRGMGWFHPTSTCAIGRVVDDELRVFGCEGLRVADGSVLPHMIRGNPNATIVMIGERAADFALGRTLAPTAADRAGA